MKVVSFVVAGAAAALFAASALPSAAAEPCPAKLSANNPAFGAPRACAAAPAKPVKSTKNAPTNDRKADEVTSADGRKLYRYGDTTIAVGGYVAADVTTGKGKMRP
ncbi:hypothetical protein [Pinisolibacter sp.]|uniref:hypothetical protein n=1 Tax=Pinisolibacter sp. TaxID=2172024 RepID=UPI002FDEC7D7